jgi:hypothetical protein
MPGVVSCQNCGGALPPSSAESPFVVCAFCGATTHVANSALVAAKVDVAGVPEGAMDRHDWSRKQLDELAGGLRAPVTYAAFSAALREMLAVHIESGNASAGNSLEDVDQLLRIGFNLGRDFSGETGVELEGIAHSRILLGGLRAVQELRTASEFELNLPFLCADSSGPKHLRRTLDAGTIAALAARAPVEPKGTASKPQPARSEQQATAQPQGFWKKLFG